MSAQKDLDAAKKLCKEGESEQQHAKHADQLAAAYERFQRASGEVSPSNPAHEGVNGTTASIVVVSENG